MYVAWMDAAVDHSRDLVCGSPQTPFRTRTKLDRFRILDQAMKAGTN